MKRSILAGFAAIGLSLAVALSAQSTSAPPRSTESLLFPPLTGDGAAGDGFGISLAFVDDMLAVGAYGDALVRPGRPSGSEEGSVYFYRPVAQGWETAGKLTQGDGEDGDNFGQSLQMDATQLIVGAPRRRVAALPEVGAVQVFAREESGLSFRQLIEPPDGSVDDRFGLSLALDGDWLAIGAPRKREAGVEVGAVYVYRRGSNGLWSLKAQLRPAQAAAGDAFGFALSWHPQALVVGAPGRDNQVSDVGALWFFERTATGVGAGQSLLGTVPGARLGSALAVWQGQVMAGAPDAGAGDVRAVARAADGSWGLGAALVVPGRAPGDRFGAALAAAGDRLAVGAPNTNAIEGAVYLIVGRPDLVASSERYAAPLAGRVDRLGVSVALTASGVLAGADLFDVGVNSSQGQVREFRTNASAQPVTVIDQGDGYSLDRFGNAVAMRGDTALVAAFLENTAAGTDSGSVHVYRRQTQGWQWQGRLTPPDPKLDQRFGSAVAYDGRHAVVGALWDPVEDQPERGAAYVYRQGDAGFEFMEKLVAVDGQEGDNFGSGVAVRGEVLVVAARRALGEFFDQGFAYVYVLDNGRWQRRARLAAPDPDFGQFFGAALAIDEGGRIIVGAPVADAAGLQAPGVAHVYVPDGNSWRYLQTLTAVPAEAEAAYAFAVAADQGRLLVGAFGESTPTAAAEGVVHAYRWNGSLYQFESRLRPPQPGSLQFFGFALALDQRRLLVGAPGVDVGTQNDVGAVYDYQYDGRLWRLRESILAQDLREDDTAGRVLTLSGSERLLGAPVKSRVNPLEGGAYAWRVENYFESGFE